MNQPVSWEESESLDYITIAKAGGRKDLLSHTIAPEGCTPRAHAGPSVDWFAHPTPPQLDYDPSYESALSRSWMQWTCPSSDTGLPRLPNKHRQNKHHRTRSEPVRLPKLPQTDKDSVDFSRLLTLDYQREWLEERETKQQEFLRKAKIKKAAQRKKLREHTIKARKIAGIDKVENKERFIMKRFSNVPARVKLPPL